MDRRTPIIRIWVRKNMESPSKIEENFHLGARPFISAIDTEALKNKNTIGEYEQILQPKTTIAGFSIKNLVTIWDLIKKTMEMQKNHSSTSW